MQTLLPKQTEIRLERGPHHFTFDTKADRIYVSNNKSNSIQVIDGYSNQVVDKISIDKPRNLVFNEKEKKLFVISGFTDFGHLNRTGANISIFDTLTNKLIKEVGEREGFTDIGLHQNSNLIYSPTRNSKKLISLNCKTGKIVDKIELERKPNFMAIDSKTNKIYLGDYDRSTISVIDIIKKNSKMIASNNHGDIEDLVAGLGENRIYFKERNTWSSESSGGFKDWVNFIECKTNEIQTLLDGEDNKSILLSNDTENGVFFLLEEKKKFSLFQDNKELGSIHKSINPRKFLVNPKTYKFYLSNNGLFKNTLYVFEDIRQMNSAS